MKIVLLEPLAVTDEVIAGLSAQLKEANHEFVAYDTVTKDSAEMIQRIGDAEILMIANNTLPGDVIRASKNLKYISVAFTGIDHVDLEACREGNIAVSNAAGYSNESVAELVIGMIISQLRNLVACDQVVREGKTKDGLVGYELNGKTVGVVGTGAIGLRTAEILKAFGCRLLGYDVVEREAGIQLGIEYVSLDTLLAESDIVTLHTPMIEATRFLINETNLKLMKPTALLVNCARGEVIDMKAVVKALNEDKLARAAVDVYEIEPPLPVDHVMFGAKNTLLTPHVAFATKESMVKRAIITFDNVYAWLEGKQLNKML